MHQFDHSNFRFRRTFALYRVRGAIAVLALLLVGMQLALQTHLITHDLLPANNPVCEHCVIAKTVAPPPTLVPLRPALFAFIVPNRSLSLSFESRSILTPRNRGPPVAA